MIFTRPLYSPQKKSPGRKSPKNVSYCNTHLESVQVAPKTETDDNPLVRIEMAVLLNPIELISGDDKVLYPSIIRFDELLLAIVITIK